MFYYSSPNGLGQPVALKEEAKEEEAVGKKKRRENQENQRTTTMRGRKNIKEHVSQGLCVSVVRTTRVRFPVEHIWVAGSISGPNRGARVVGNQSM